MKDYTQLQEKVLNAAKKCLEMGLIHGTSGNVSMADRENDVVVITPSGIPYDELKPEDMPVVRLSDGEWIEGKYKPSSETPMHTAILRSRKTMTACVHTHSIYATVCSIFMDELPSVAAASTPYCPIKTAPFALPGSQEIAEGAVEAIGDGVACLLRNHGQIVCGPTIDKAISIADYVEENAQTAYLAYAVDKLIPIPEKEFKIMHDRAVKSMGLL